MMRRLASNGFGRGRPNAVPAWRVGLAPWQWVELPDTAAFSGQKPANWADLVASGGLAGRLDAWSGFTASHDTVYIAGSGGHVDWAGNDVYGMSLSATSPAWSMLKTASLIGDVVIDSPYYLDGKPSSLHLYYNQHFVGAEVIRPNSALTYGSGNYGSVKAASFSTTTNDWRAANTYPDAPTSAYAQAACRDPRDGTIYFVGDFHMYSRAASGAWTQRAAMPDSGSAAYYAASAVDTLRDRVVIFDDTYQTSGGGLLYTIGGSVSKITFTGTDVASVIAPAGHSAHYLPTIDRFVLKTSNADDVYLIHPTTWVITKQSTTGGGGIVNAMSGNFNKFIPVTAYGGYFYQPRHSSNAYFLAVVSL